MAKLAALAAMCCGMLNAQTITSDPPAALVESTRTLQFIAQGSGFAPNQSTALLWGNNGQVASNTNGLVFDVSSAPPGVPVVLKAVSQADVTKFAAAPILRLNRSDLAQIAAPNAIAYHPMTGAVYAAVLTAQSNDVTTNIVQVAADGSQTNVISLPKSTVAKMVPYISGGRAYLLVVDFENNQISALDLSAKTIRKIVGGLQGPISAALHPVTGDLYIAEFTARRISAVSRSALEAAVSGGSNNASFGALPITLNNLSGVGFLADPSSAKVSLLASSADGALYQVDLGSNNYSAIATNLQVTAQVLVLQAAQTGFAFVLTGSSTKFDGQGSVAALSVTGKQNNTSPYAMAAGLDLVTDLAYVPPGTPYSATGKWLILAASFSATPSRGRIARWEPDSGIQGDYYVYADRVQPSLSLDAPAPADVLLPGAPIELRWSYKDANPLNPSVASFAALAQIQISTDGGNSFSNVGPPVLPAGPQNGQYRQSFQVPLTAAGHKIRLAVQMSGLDGSPLRTTTGDLNVQPADSGLPKALSVNPNFAVAAQSAAVNVDGLNLQAGSTIHFGDQITISGVEPVSATRLQAQVLPAGDANGGARAVSVCNPNGCQDTGDAFYVLPPDGPQITSVLPQSGPPGTTVLINGNNFSSNVADDLVTFGNLPAIVYDASPTQLLVDVPFGVNRGEMPISVTINSSASNSSPFFIAPARSLAPVVSADGVVNGASFAAGSSPVAPGSIASLFGANLVPDTAAADLTPLPTQLLNTSVLVGGIAAPLFFASPTTPPAGQINFQIPEEAAGWNSVAVTVISNGVSGNTIPLNIAPQVPGIFSQTSDGKGAGAVLNEDGSPNSADNPEHVGRTLQVYVTGLGISEPPVPTGFPAGSNPVPNSRPPLASIDNLPATVTFVGRSPGFVGLDQVNIVIPPGVTTGKPVPLVINANLHASNTVTVVVAP